MQAKDFKRRHVEWASNMKFIYSMASINNYAQHHHNTAPRIKKDVVTEKAQLEKLLDKEARIKHSDEPDNDNESANVMLIGDDLKWIWGVNQKTQEEQVYSWYFMAVDIYFPRANSIYTVALNHCIEKKELEELKENPPDVAKGWIYPEVRYHYVHAKLNEI